MIKLLKKKLSWEGKGQRSQSRRRQLRPMNELDIDVSRCCTTYRQGLQGSEPPHPQGSGSLHGTLLLALSSNVSRALLWDAMGENDDTRIVSISVGRMMQLWRDGCPQNTGVVSNTTGTPYYCTRLHDCTVFQRTKYRYTGPPGGPRNLEGGCELYSHSMPEAEKTAQHTCRR